MSHGAQMLTERYADALQLAWRLHARQLRKGTTIPCVSHLIEVSGIALAVPELLTRPWSAAS